MKRRNTFILILAFLLSFVTACDKSTKKENDISHVHELGDLVEAKESTCKLEGNIAYYTCKTCGKYFDESKNEIDCDSIYLEKKEHAYKSINGVFANFDSDGYASHYECENCDMLFDLDKNVIENENDLIIQKYSRYYGKEYKYCIYHDMIVTDRDLESSYYINLGEYKQYMIKEKLVNAFIEPVYIKFDENKAYFTDDLDYGIFELDYDCIRGDVYIYDAYDTYRISFISDDELLYSPCNGYNFVVCMSTKEANHDFETIEAVDTLCEGTVEYNVCKKCGFKFDHDGNQIFTIDKDKFTHECDELGFCTKEDCGEYTGVTANKETIRANIHFYNGKGYFRFNTYCPKHISLDIRLSKEGIDSNPFSKIEIYDMESGEKVDLLKDEAPMINDLHYDYAISYSFDNVHLLENKEYYAVIYLNDTSIDVLKNVSIRGLVDKHVINSETGKCEECGGICSHDFGVGRSGRCNGCYRDFSEDVDQENTEYKFNLKANETKYIYLDIDKEADFIFELSNSDIIMDIIRIEEQPAYIQDVVSGKPYYIELNGFKDYWFIVMFKNTTDMDVEFTFKYKCLDENI